MCYSCDSSGVSTQEHNSCCKREREREKERERDRMAPGTRSLSCSPVLPGSTAGSLAGRMGHERGRSL